MIELRYYVEKWDEYTEYGYPKRHIEDPVLQYRVKDISIDPVMLCLVETEWSEWMDVPTVGDESLVKA